MLDSPRDWCSLPVIVDAEVPPSTAQSVSFSLETPPPVGSSVIVTVGLGASRTLTMSGGAGVTWTRLTSSTSYSTSYGDLEVWRGVGFNGTDNLFNVEVPSVSTSCRVVVLARWLKFVETPVAISLSATGNTTRASGVVSGSGLHQHLSYYNNVQASVVDFSTQMTAVFTPPADEARWSKRTRPGITSGTIRAWMEDHFYLSDGRDSQVTWTESTGEDPLSILRSMFYPMPSKLGIPDFDATSDMTVQLAAAPFSLIFDSTSGIEIFTTIAEPATLGSLALDGQMTGEVVLTSSVVTNLDPVTMDAVGNMEVVTDTSYVWIFTFSGTSDGEAAVVVATTFDSLTLVGTADMQTPEIIYSSQNLIVTFGPGGNLPTSGVFAPTEPDFGEFA